MIAEIFISIIKAILISIVIMFMIGVFWMQSIGSLNVTLWFKICMVFIDILIIRFYINKWWISLERK